MRTSSQTINLHTFNRYVTISTFLMWQGCGSSSKMTLVETALNLGERLKIYPQVLTFFIKLQISSFHVVVLLTTAKKWTKIKNARAGRAKLLFLPTNYANLWRSRCRRRCRCLSSLLLNKVESFLWHNKLPQQEESLAKTSYILALVAHIWKTNSVTPVFYCRNEISYPGCQRFFSLRATE